jgi:hypothetical protein
VPVARCARAALVLAALDCAACRAAPPVAPPNWRVPAEDGLIEHLLAEQAAESPAVAAVLADPAAYRAQVLYSEVVPGSAGRPVLERHAWRLDAEYVYPASAIKLPAAVAAVEFLNARGRELGVEIPLDAPLTFHALHPGEERADSDPTNLDGESVTVLHEIRKLFLASDNRAFDRLYDLCGQAWLGSSMRRAGLDTVHFAHRLGAARTAEENRRAPRVELRLVDRVIEWPERVDPVDPALDNLAAGWSGLEVGSDHVTGAGLAGGPMDFRWMNAISLRDLEECLVKLARPDVELGTPGFDLTPEQRELLLAAMREYPGDSRNPVYDRARFPDDGGKLLLPGLERAGPRERWSVANKAGLGYGFAVESSYVEDRATGRAFFLTAVVYCNADEIVGDERYEYEEVALPFMAALAEVIALRRPAAP